MLNRSWKKSKVVKNAGWIIGGRVFNKLLALVVSALTARFLGPGNYGLINYAAAYTTFFASICTLGINSILVKNLMDHPEEEGQTIGTALLLRGVSSALSALMIVGIVSIVDKGEPITIIVVALSGIGLVFQIFDSLNYWFQARLESKYSALASFIAYAVASAYKILLLVKGMSVQWFAVATAVDYLVIAIFLLAAYFAKGGKRFRFSMKKAGELLGASKSFIISGLMVSVYASTDKLMLKQMLDDTTVGYYSTAESVTNMWVFVLAAIIDSFYPTIVQAFQEGKSKFERKNRQLYTIVFYVACGASLVISLLAKPVIQIIYGDAYLQAVQPLRIIVWYTAFSYLGVARNAWIVCENLQKYLKYIYIGAGMLNVLLNAVFIPLWGISGAALASLVTQVATIVLFPALIRPMRPNVKLMIDAVRLKGVFSKEQGNGTEQK